MAVNVLLVEDSLADARIAKEIIGETKCEVSLTIARDGLQAASAIKEICLKKSVPTVLLLDLRFPHGDGFQILDLINRSSCSNKIKKVVLTGSQRPEDRTKAEKLGADAYFNKPTTPNEIDQLVGALRSIMEGFSEQGVY